MIQNSSYTELIMYQHPAMIGCYPLQSFRNQNWPSAAKEKAAFNLAHELAQLWGLGALWPKAPEFEADAVMMLYQQLACHMVNCSSD